VGGAKTFHHPAKENVSPRLILEKKDLIQLSRGKRVGVESRGGGKKHEESPPLASPKRIGRSKSVKVNSLPTSSNSGDAGEKKGKSHYK